MSDRISIRSKSSKQIKWSETSTSRPTSTIEEVRNGENENGNEIGCDLDDTDEEMTFEEKEEMYNVVKIGDIDRFEELLWKPNADIKMLWYSENLLMTAIRFKQEEMAEFLLDNGVDQNHSRFLIRNPEAGIGKTEQYTYSCRQMAYDHELFDIVEIIDVMNNQLFPGIKPKPRVPRYRRDKPATPSPVLSPAHESDAFEIENQEKTSSPKRKIKKLVKRVSADLLSLLDESDDESQKFKKLPRRRSLPPGVGKNKKSVKEGSEKSIDRDSGVQSLESCANPSEKNMRSKSLKPKRVSINQSPRKDPINKNNNNEEASIIGPSKLSLDSDAETGINDKVKSVRENQQMSSSKFKVFGNVARASRPLSAYQYVTDHSKCLTLGYKQEPSPMTLDKIRCHGSYIKESKMWKMSDNKKQNLQIGLLSRRVFSAPSPRHYSKIDPNFVMDLRYNRKNITSLLRRKIEPKFRNSYLTLDHIPPCITNVTL